MHHSTALLALGEERGQQLPLDMFETAAIGLGLLSPTGHWLRVNRRLALSLGDTQSAMVGRPFQEIIAPPAENEAVFDLAGMVANGGMERALELRCRRRNGSWLWCKVTFNRGREPGNATFFVSVQDIHIQKTLEDTLAAERRLMIRQLRMQSAVFNATQEGMLIISPEDLAVSCNPAFTEITDYTNEDIRDRHVSFLFSTHHNTTFWPEIKIALARHGNWAGESWNRRKSGEVYLDWTTIHALTDDNEKLLNYVLTSIDITRMPHAKSELARLAFSDALTGLPNRNLLMNRLNHAISRARRNATTGAVLYIDLDGFKAVNDRHGHIAGDELLKQVANRLKHRLREVDTLARMGGDEFIAVLEEVRKPEGVGIVAKALIGALQRPFDLPGAVSVCISGSIGVAMFGNTTPDAASIIAQADHALYAAKNAGRACYRLDFENATIN